MRNLTIHDQAGKLLFRIILLTALFSRGLLFVPAGFGQASPPGNTVAYRLIGTIESDGFSGAVVDDASGKQSFYRLFDRLPDGAQIVTVRNNSILVRRSDGSMYEIFIVHDTKGPAQSAALPVHTGYQQPSPVSREPGDFQQEQLTARRPYEVRSASPERLPMTRPTGPGRFPRPNPGQRRHGPEQEPEQ